MNVTKSEIVLRDRHFWECVDMGAPMYRRWFGPIVAFFSGPYITIASVLLITFRHLPAWLPILAIWWLKPLWDRLIMVPAGVLLFEPRASLRTMARSLTRIFSLSLAWDLTWRRISPFRAYLIPVSMFEQPGRKARRKRMKTLRRDLTGQFIGIVILFLLLEALVVLSLSLTISAFGSVDVIAFRSTAEHFDRVFRYTLIYAAVVLCVEPLFTLSSFAMYVNRRTQAEGWDLQLTFSRLRATLSSGRVAPFVLAAALLFSLPIAGAHAQEAGHARSSTSAFEARAKTVLQGAEFGGTERRNELRIKPGSLASLGSSGSGDSLLGLLSAQTLRIVVIALVLVLAVVAVIMGRRRIVRAIGIVRRRRTAETVALAEKSAAFGGSEWLSAAERAWAEGAHREALAFLYRGTIEAAHLRFGITLSESATERDCLEAVRDAAPAPDFLDSFERLTRFWIRVAWAEKTPDDTEFNSVCGELSRTWHA